MQRIYSHVNPAMVHHVKNVLDNHGIESEVRGEHLVGAIGGIAPIDAWVELWLVDESRLQEAERIVEDLLVDTDVEATGEESEPWTCPNCGEEVDAQFAVCWNCGSEGPEEAA